MDIFILGYQMFRYIAEQGPVHEYKQAFLKALKTCTR